MIHSPSILAKISEPDRLMPGPPRIPIILATRNRKKGRELAELISPSWETTPRLGRIEVQTLDGRSDVPEVVEDDDTFVGNARKKATEVARATRSWALADDSGLAVDALGGNPGVFSARYAGEPADDAANNRKLLEALDAIPDDCRGAAFCCHLALADPTGAIRLESAGICRGRITRTPQGSGGFGYDPLFLILEYHKTFGELSPLVKHQLSHRSRAFVQLRMTLDRLIAAGVMDSSARAALSRP